MHAGKTDVWGQVCILVPGVHRHGSYRGAEPQGKAGVCGGFHPSWQVQLVAYDDSLPPLCCWDAALQ